MGCHALLLGSCRPSDPTRASYVSSIGRRVLYHYRHLGSPRRSVRPPCKGHRQDTHCLTPTVRTSSLTLPSTRFPSLVIFFLKNQIIHLKAMGMKIDCFTLRRTHTATHMPGSGRHTRSPPTLGSQTSRHGLACTTQRVGIHPAQGLIPPERKA